jgi:hypothetical protein
MPQCTLSTTKNQKEGNSFVEERNITDAFRFVSFPPSISMDAWMGISYSDHKVTITMDKEQDEEGRGSHTE